MTYTAAYNAPTMLVGDQVVETTVDSNAAGQAEAFLYTATASGSANRLYVYLDPSSTATKVVLGLYANAANDTIGGLLTQGTIAAPVAGGWNSVDVPVATVTAGAKYWISILNPPATGAVQFRDKSGGTIAQTSAQTNLTTLPAAWSAGQSWFSSPASAYAAQVGTVAADTQVPTVSLTAPAAASTVSGATVTVSANATDNVGVTSVQFLLDGAPLGAGHGRAVQHHLGQHQGVQRHPRPQRPGEGRARTIPARQRTSRSPSQMQPPTPSRRPLP